MIPAHGCLNQQPVLRQNKARAGLCELNASATHLGKLLRPTDRLNPLKLGMKRCDECADCYRGCDGPLTCIVPHATFPTR